MFCFKGNLGSAKGAQLTAQESENDSPPSFTKTIQRNSLAGFHLPPRHRGSREDAKEDFSLPGHSGSELFDEHPHRDQSVTK